MQKFSLNKFDLDDLEDNLKSISNYIKIIIEKINKFSEINNFKTDLNDFNLENIKILEEV